MARPRRLTVLWAAGFVAALASCTTPLEPRPVARSYASLLFLGDTYFGEGYDGAPRPRYDLDPALDRLLSASDAVVVNLEGPLARRTGSPLEGQKTPLHLGAPETANALAAAGVDAASLANNHALDFGPAGLSDTRATLAAAGIAAFGAGKDRRRASEPWYAPWPRSSRAPRVAVFGAYWHRRRYASHYGFYAGDTHPGVLDIRDLAARIAAEPGATFVVAYPHWGRNYRWRDQRQQELAHALVDAGADLVVGHGAHAAQEIERYRDRWIFYNIGNFVFATPGRYATMQWHRFSLTVELRLGEHPELAVRLLSSDNRTNGYHPALLRGRDFDGAVATLRHASCHAGTCGVWQHGDDVLGPYLRLAL